MDWPEALDLVIGRTRHEAYRGKCADSHPDHLAWRRRMIEQATGQATTPAEYPSLWRMAGNLAGAAGRVVAAAVKGEPIRVTPEVYHARLAICQGCEQYDHAKGRCRICGCWTSRKLALATESCPLPEPKWGPVHDGD